ncbi:MAG: hypothetical protein JNJ54_13370 [Myxococcaceae bacterium]|nr:hypothetical protein [Myxococcaceae bacterium]
MCLRAAVLAASILLACEQGRSSGEPQKPQDEADPTPAVAAAVLSAKAGPRARPEKDKESKRRPRSILLAEARELVGWRVADGFLGRKDIVELAMQSADGRESLRSEIEALVDDELAAHRRREAAWRYLTAPDRLTRAFTALDKQGVIARERFTDCRKCGLEEMKALREDWLEDGKRADGYVFFTDQDADGVSESGELVLEFGSFREGGEADRKIGERVSQALRAEGLEAVAETDEGEAYLVLTGLEWQKRRFTRPPR